MSERPSITVVIPAHNAAPYLAEAICSVLAQTRHPLEVVVVDDESTDETLAIARSFGGIVRTESVERAGAGAARNLGVAVARGDTLAFLDADDIWRPEKLEAQVDALAASDIVFGMLDEFLSPELAQDVKAGLRARAGLHPGHVVSAMLLRRTTFERVGPFATHLAVGEFVDWIARAKTHALRETTISKHVLRRRVHGANSTLRERDSLTDLARVLKLSLDRRRLDGAA